MLALKNIVKNYVTGSTRVEALRGVSVEFRRSEFVSILGPSGCGKTTLLNIIGGLDQYDGGDLTIGGVSTKKFKDRDWDSYRNHSVGFVFQSYNLIPHQTVLSNVELALTLSGVSRAERRRRAVEALQKVGLEDQISKRPNMLSGGQMQRVAIARALVNDPEILLADEPTGALDSETSLQVMEIMKQVAQDRLVIMVTHNPSLAEQYSTRIIRLSDGQITSDSDPYTESATPVAAVKESGRTRMSFGTALSLSLNNLMTKKARTLLTSFAGSIGIIGIALILALSSGVNSYINSVQAETLGEYPLTIESQAADMAGVMGTIMGFTASVEEQENTDGRIHSVNMMSAMFQSMLSGMQQNDLASFRVALDEAMAGPLGEHVTAVKYGYDLALSVYKEDTSSGAVQVNPSTVVDALYGSTASQMYSTLSQYSMGGMELWNELTGDEPNTGYSLVAGAWPKEADELLLIVNEDLLVTDYSLYSLGIRDQAELTGMVNSVFTGEAYSAPETSYAPEDLLSLRFRLLVPTDRYQEEDGVYRDVSGDPDTLASLVDGSMTLRVVGVAKAPSGSASLSGSIGYTKSLTNYVIDAIDASPVVAAQKENPDIDILTGLPFASGSLTMDDVRQYIASLPEDEAASTAAYIQGMTEEEVLALFASKITPEASTATFEGNLALFGAVDSSSPSSINIYTDSFASKDEITDFIDSYNLSVRAEGREDAVIEYTDYVGLLMNSVTTITNAISYVLIAFVSVSLVVSSIMIGVITYISVLERTKEIGILRAIGASKGDISRVFNAETVIVGLTSGLMGILITALLCIPINLIIENLTDISGIAALPPLAGGILVLISVSLTLIAGLLPSRMAAKRDPVVALRAE